MIQSALQLGAACIMFALMSGQAAAPQTLEIAP
jgi:hypothetical protein